MQLGHFGRQSQSDLLFTACRDRLLVTGGSSDGFLVLWDLFSGSQIRSFRAPDVAFAAAAVDLGCTRLVTASSYGVAQLWDVRTGALLQQLEAPHQTDSVAISKDGQQLATGHSSGVVRLWSAKDGAAVGQLGAKEEAIDALAFYSNGERIVSARGDEVTLWQTSDRTQLGSVEHNLGRVGRLLPAETDQVALAIGPDSGVVAIDLSSGRLAWQLPELRVKAVAGNGLTALVQEEEGHGELRSLPGGAVLRRYLRPIVSQAATLTANGEHFVTFWQSELVLVDSATGRRLHGFEEIGSPVRSIDISTDQRFVLAGHSDGSVRVWDLRYGRIVRSRRGHQRPVEGVSFTDEKDLIVSGSGDGTVRFWDVTGGFEIPIRRQGFGAWVKSVHFTPMASRHKDMLIRRLMIQTQFGAHVCAFDGYLNPLDREDCPLTGPSVNHSFGFTPDGTQLAHNRVDGGLVLWNFAGGGEPRVFETEGTPLRSATFSPDGNLVAAADMSGLIRIWEVASGALRQTMRSAGSQGSSHLLHSGYALITALAFSPDGRLLLAADGPVASSQNHARLWDIASGEPRHILRGHVSRLIGAGFVAGGSVALTASEDGSIRLWRVDDGRELAALYALKDDHWLAVTREGVFDTSQLVQISAAQLISADAPFSPLPLELLIATHYEPGLVPKLLNGSAASNRAVNVITSRPQPEIEILDASIDAIEGKARLTVAVGDSSKPTNERLRLRVFRDGQLVASRDDVSDGRVETFDGIALNRESGRRWVELSAYALNEGHTKSRTSVRTLRVPASIPRRRGRAYVVSVGIDNFDDSSLNLRHAANDARELSKWTREWLEFSNRFEEVVSVVLENATKRHIRAAIERLSGATEPAASRGLGLEGLAPLQPEDLLLLFFSTHGIASADGSFHLLPSDNRQGRRTISSHDLFRWFGTGLEGEVVLVLDACYSANVFEREGFRPGPLGSRSLGQLSYDKGIRILAAAQANGVAIETGKLQHGLLTYALVYEAIADASASHSVRDMRLAEWLRYGVERVPGLYRDLYEGRIENARGVRPLRDTSSHGAAPPIQQPVLFDFRESTRDRWIIPGYRLNYERAGDEAMSNVASARAPDEALDAFEEAADWYREAADPEGIAVAKQASADLRRKQRALDDAVAATRSAMQSWRDAKLWVDLGHAELSLGEMLWDLGRGSEALIVLEQAHLRLSERGERHGAATAAMALCKLYREAGEEVVGHAWCDLAAGESRPRDSNEASPQTPKPASAAWATKR